MVIVKYNQHNLKVSILDTLIYYKYFRGKSLNKKFSEKSHFGGDNSHHDKNVIGTKVTSYYVHTNNVHISSQNVLERICKRARGIILVYLQSLYKCISDKRVTIDRAVTRMLARLFAKSDI